MAEVSHGSAKGAGSPLFDRRVRILYAEALPGTGNYTTITNRVVQVEDLRVEFTLKRSLKKTPNPGKIVITNLSEDNQAFMTGHSAKVILEAGYKNGIFRIFQGDVHFIDHDNDNPSVATVIELRDGGRAYREAHISQSFSAGTPAGKLIETFAGKLGLKIGNLHKHTARLDASRTHQNGYAAHGNVARELDLVLQAAGLEWSIQDDTLQILEPQGVTGRVWTLNADSGLVGSPKHGSPPKKGHPRTLRVRSLIMPYVPGDEVDVDSVAVKGRYKIVDVTFTGDTHGPAWYADLDCIPKVVR